LRIFKILGTPNEKIWAGIIDLKADYKTAFPVYPPLKLKNVVTGLDDDGYDLLEKMLVYDPNKRLLAAKALEHPYFDAIRTQDVGNSTETQN